MEMALVCWGTTGDVAPMLALSRRLLDRGHRVPIWAGRRHIDAARATGPEVHELGPAVDPDDYLALIDEMVGARNRIESLRLMMDRGLVRYALPRYRELLDTVEGFDAVVCHASDVAAQEAAIRHGLPWASVIYSPNFIPSAARPPLLPFSLGRWGNLALWAAVRRVLARRVDPMLDELVEALGGERRPSMTLEGLYSPHLSLVAASPALAGGGAPAPHLMTGLWRSPEAPFEPDPELARFVSGGEPPIVFTFGSMGGTRAAQTADLLVEAAARAGRRAVLQAGWGELRATHPGPDVLQVGDIPHGWLFPRAACVVHHGGAGTSASACLAGAPSVVVPHIADQHFWAQRLYHLGAAPRPLGRTALTAARLAVRLRAVLATDRLREGARAAGAATAAEDAGGEDGIDRAVAAIEGLPGR